MHNRPVSDPALTACPHCDLLQRLPQIEPEESVRCPRCNAELWRRHRDWYPRTLALAIATAILYVVANATPMLGLSVVGREVVTTVFGGAEYLWNNGWESVGALVLFTVVVAPGLQIGFVLAILFGARGDHAPRWVGTLLRCYRMICTWSMIEVMILGVLVALIKIAELATVIPGLALFVLGALIFLIAAMQALLDPRELWRKVEWADADSRQALAGHRAEGSTP